MFTLFSNRFLELLHLVKLSLCLSNCNFTYPLLCPPSTFYFVSMIWTTLILHAEYIMRNIGLDEAQAGMKIARRNINNFR